MTQSGVLVSLRPRAIPLPPAAAVGRGSVAVALAKRLLSLSDDALSELPGVAGPSVLVVIGVKDKLPWVDGIEYLGRDPRAPSLLLPTTHEPTVHPMLLERAFLAGRRFVPPIGLLWEPCVALSTGSARPIQRTRLEAFLAEGTR